MSSSLIGAEDRSPEGGVNEVLPRLLRISLLEGEETMVPLPTPAPAADMLNILASSTEGEEAAAPLPVTAPPAAGMLNTMASTASTSPSPLTGTPSGSMGPPLLLRPAAAGGDLGMMRIAPRS